ncbi:bifunctional oligoribonuclease/PAP phosphatase NrnA [Capnocytophaga sp. ARDL2]|uniref:DHH family phosphoesterase n=1 Tax=Capnocytophaga sp. ARDL2 TaxID=3238809 RepID=UPI003557FE77
MNTNDYTQLKDLLSQPKKIAIIPHRNPDGDALGSCLGLYHILCQLNHQVSVVSPNEFPEFIAWLPDADKIKMFEKNIDECQHILSNSDIIFTLDFNALHRTGEQMESYLQSLDKTFVMLDHHQMPDDYATYTLSDTSFGSTCELLYNFIVNLGYKDLINKTVGTCIYTGIVTDSGSFRFVKTTGNTHRVVAELIDLGVENTNIHDFLSCNSSISRLQLLSRALNNLKILPSKGVAYTYLTQKDLNECNFQKGDTEGIVNYGLSLKDIQMAVIFIENENESVIKISFRSKGDCDVNNFARSYFNGGGHINAAGGKSMESLTETLDRFEKIINERF